MGLIVGTLIGLCSRTGIVYSGFRVGSGFGVNSVARGIVCCMIFATD